jgi:hypothetical protein
MRHVLAVLAMCGALALAAVPAGADVVWDLSVPDVPLCLSYAGTGEYVGCGGAARGPSGTGVYRVAPGEFLRAPDGYLLDAVTLVGPAASSNLGEVVVGLPGLGLTLVPGGGPVPCVRNAGGRRATCNDRDHDPATREPYGVLADMGMGNAVLAVAQDPARPVGLQGPLSLDFSVAPIAGVADPSPEPPSLGLLLAGLGGTGLWLRRRRRT